jgi:DNA-binding IclR family transcriptional regulator
MDLPTNTVRRALEDLAAYRLVRRHSQGKGKVDLWNASPPENN